LKSKKNKKKVIISMANKGQQQNNSQPILIQITKNKKQIKQKVNNIVYLHNKSIIEINYKK
jgi:cyclophilin family peptidyl-prolyl cis-trans isomerase